MSSTLARIISTFSESPLITAMRFSRVPFRVWSLSSNPFRSGISAMRIRKEKPLYIALYSSINMSKPKALAIISGKGGSGKTTLSVAIAKYFAIKGVKVALIDLDVKGPNLISKITKGKIPKLNIVNNKIQSFRYPEIPNLSVFSTELYTDSENGIAFSSNDMKMFLRSVFVVTDWGFEPELYICDTDPAASDTLDVLKELFKDRVRGLIISTPDPLSIDNTVRSIDVCNDRGIKLLGYIGNMGYFRCPVCHTKHYLFGDLSNLAVFNNKYNLKEYSILPFKDDFESSKEFKEAMEKLFKDMYAWRI